MIKLTRSSKILLVLTLSLALLGCGGKDNNPAEILEGAEKQDKNVAIENPWTESDEKGVLEATGYNVKAPEDATEVHYSFCADEKMAQVTYQKDNIDWTYRIKESTEAEDISGMNYEWNVSEEGTVSGKKAIYMGYSDAKEGSDFIDDVKYIQVVNWYDDLTGVSYSLSASGNDLNGMDIQVYAEQIYESLQKEVTDVSYKTYETGTFDGTVIKIDETNIISQEKVEDVLETTLVPSEAEVIAPGRDFVYLADANNYYVEDVVDQLLTIAKKSDTGDELNSKK